MGFSMRTPRLLLALFLVSLFLIPGVFLRCGFAAEKPTILKPEVAACRQYAVQNYYAIVELKNAGVSLQEILDQTIPKENQPGTFDPHIIEAFIRAAYSDDGKSMLKEADAWVAECVRITKKPSV